MKNKSNSAEKSAEFFYKLSFVKINIANLKKMLYNIGILYPKG